MRINKCRSCKSKKLDKVFNLGKQAFTGLFPNNRKEHVTKGDLSLVICKNCSLLQLEHTFNPDEMYGENYGYMSSLNQSMFEHLKNKVPKLQKKINLSSKDIVIDIGSNDGTFLGFFEKKFN
jgi:ribosomal protein L32